MTGPEAEPTPLPVGPFAGRETFRDRLRQAFARAAQERWRQMVWCDVDFADWPLGERVVVEALNAWARQRGQLLMMATDFQTVPRMAPLFVRWRQQWSYRMECLALTGVAASDVPSVLAAPAWCLRRLDPLRSSGACVNDAQTLADVNELIASLRDKGTPAFPADVLGL